MESLSGAYEYAIEPLHYAENNPCARVKYPKFERKSDKGHYYIQPDTYANITELFQDKPYFLIPIIIGYRCGLRIGETFGLTWDNIDFDSGTITIDKQVVKRNFGLDVRKTMQSKGQKEERSNWYFAPPKTESAYRTISVDSDTMNQLRRYYTAQKENMLTYGEYYTEYYIKNEINEKGDSIQRLLPVQRSIPCSLPKASLVMVRSNGEYVSTDSFKYASRIIHNKIKEPFDFHSLRHTHATTLAELGTNPETARRRLGHSDIKVTLQYYTHVTEKLENDMREKLEELFAHNKNQCGQDVDKTS